MIWNLPNTLTWLRIFAIPLVIVLFYLPYNWADPAAGLLFAAAGITDSLDGYFARKMGQTSRLGAFLDPVADKLIVAVALVLLVSKEMPPIFVPRCGRNRYARSWSCVPSSSSVARSPSPRCASGWRRSGCGARSR
jgi:hypothetical protein